jgi:hypothetical protein
MPSLRDELEQLEAILERQLPRHASSREQVELDESELGGVAQLWAQVGWSAALAASGLERPSLSASRTRARELLAAYRRADSSFALRDEALPESLLLVEVSEVGAGFSFVRADADEEDPELEMLSTEASAIIQLSPSSLRWIATMLVKGAFAHWYRTFVGLRPPQLLTADGVAPLPRLSPALRYLGPELWIVPTQLDASTVPEAGSQLAHRDLRALVDWLLALPYVDTLTLGKLPGARIDLAPAAAELTRPDWRTFAHGEQADAHFCVGTIAEHPVLVYAGPYVRELATAPGPEPRTRVEAELRAWGWLGDGATWRL